MQQKLAEEGPRKLAELRYRMDNIENKGDVGLLLDSSAPVSKRRVNNIEVFKYPRYGDQDDIVSSKYYSHQMCFSMYVCMYNFCYISSLNFIF